MLSINNLVKYFGQNKVLDSISFDLVEGRITGLLGPNGAGKTTTIRILTGVLPYTSGEIKLDGKPFNPRSKEWKTKLGIVPEISNAFLDYSPIKNLLFIGGVYGIPKKISKARSLKLLEDFGLIEKINNRTKRLSKGQKQRLNVSMAMVHDPDFYFLDEPTTGLDIHSVQFIRNKILELKNTGKTILLTTHNLIEANLLCDEVLILNKGRIIAKGTPNELREKFAPASKILLEFEKPFDNFGLFEKLGISYEVTSTKNKIYFYTTNTIDDFPKIVELIKELKIEPITCEIKPSSLEEIFLKILEEDIK
ncbi:MAG: ABC transporter ATP-binding protein [Candidatus Helarchaeota archaeon]